MTAGWLRFKGGDQNVKIAISSKNGARLSGRITDSKGNPLPHAAVEVRMREDGQNGPSFPGEVAHFARDGKLETDADGRFQTPPVPRDRSYRFEVDVVGHGSGKSEWLKVDDVLHEFTVSRRINLNGTVRDRAGQPVAGAKIAYLAKTGRTTAISDDAGRFELKSIPESEGFLFIGHDGFRFHGEAVKSASSPIERVLLRTSEPSTSVLTSRPLVPREERLKLAHRILDPLADRLLNPMRSAENEMAQRRLPFRRSQEQQLLELVPALAKVEPQTVLDYLDRHLALADREMIRVQAAKELRYRSVERTLALISRTRTPHSACFMLCDLFDVIDPQDRELRLELLAEALAKARETKEPSFRVLGLGNVGKRLFELGEKERATTALREGQEAARRLSPLGVTGHARGTFAERLALIDVDGALELTKDLVAASEFVRHHGNMAHELAALDPEQAERVLNQITKNKETPGFDRDRYAIRVPYRMASRDLPRARRIAESMSLPATRAFAYGVIADALAKSQPATASELLRQSFAILDEIAAEPDSPRRTLLTPGTIAGDLLATAERVDSSLVPEFYWHALSFQRPPTEDPAEKSRVFLSNAALAGFVARYDVAAAKQLLKTLGDREPEPRNLAWVAVLLIDPVKAVERVEAMPEGPELNQKDLMRLEVAEQLATRDARYWELPAANAGLWIMDDFDLGE
jgi:hypothetical protein